MRSYAYCGISVDNGFIVESEGELGEWTWMQDIKPATKEQYELLFAMMKEAGYEWDAEKKVLKKIEDKPLVIDEGKDEIDRNFTEMMLKDYTKQKPIEWSEKDESMRTRCIGILGKCCIGELPTKVEEELNWLKSLKPQKQCGYNPYKATVESIAEMCKHYDVASHSGLRDFYANVKVKCKEAIEYDKKYPQKQWKPSDELIQALERSADYLHDYGKNDDDLLLLRLLEELKKLKE